MTKAKIATITPDYAKKLLGANNHNRTLRQSHVAWFEGILKRGEWKLTPDAVAVGHDGTLINGQHRMSAIANTGISAQCVLLAPEGLAAKAKNHDERIGLDMYEATDSGLLRTLSDRTGIKPALVSLVRAYITTHSGIVKPTVPQFFECYQQHKEAFDFVNSVRPHEAGVGLVSGWVPCVEFYIRHKDESRDFILALATPATPIQQAAMLREYYFSLKNGRIYRGNPAAAAVRTRAIHCMKQYLRNRIVRQYRQEDWDE